MLYVQLLRCLGVRTDTACVSLYDQSAWTVNLWWSSKRCTYRKRRCATVL